jgi:Stress-induced bacterial acidophilic repeat motif.
MEEKKGSMTVREAGQKGGEKTAKSHGHEFYEEIGHKGGEKADKRAARKSES